MLCSIVRFKQAANRLEVTQGVHDAPNKLLARLVRRFDIVNLRDGPNNHRVYDMAKHPIPPPLDPGHRRLGSKEERVRKIKDAMQFVGVRPESKQ